MLLSKVSNVLLVIDGVVAIFWVFAVIVLSCVDSEKRVYKFVERALPVMAVTIYVVLYIGVGLLLSTCFR